MTTPASTRRPATTTGYPVRGADSRNARALVGKVISRWRQGEKADARRVLIEHPEVTKDHSLVLDLALEEYCLRRERGDRLGPQTFREMFESFGVGVAASVERQVEIEEIYDRQRISRERIEWPCPGERVGEYQVVEELGRGGLARVYLCREEPVGGRLVVLKICSDATSEPHWLGRLTHPNIVPVLSARPAFADRGTLVCMPFLGRCTLNDLIVEANGTGKAVDGAAYLTRVSDPEASPAYAPDSWLGLDSERVLLRLQLDIAAALAYAHKQGVVHGDVKPTNVLATPAGGLLIDFNLSFACGIEAASVGGTLPYLAPERVSALQRKDRNGGAGPAIDSFAFGVTLADSVLLSSQTEISKLTLANGGDESELYDSQRAHIAAARARLPSNSHLTPLLDACVSRAPDARPTAVQIQDSLEREQGRLAARWNGRSVTRRVAVVVAGTGLCGFLVRVAAAGPTPSQRYQRARGYIADARYEEAVTELDRALDQEPDRFDARYSRAWALIEVGKIDSAIRDLRFLERRAHDDYVAASLGYCRATGADFTSAAAWYERVAGEVGESAETLNNHACSYWKGRSTAARAEQLATAREMFLRASVLRPSDPVPLLNLVLMQADVLRGGLGQVDAETARRTAAGLLDRTNEEGAILAAACLYALLEGDQESVDRRRSTELIMTLAREHAGPTMARWEGDIAFQFLRADAPLERRVTAATRRVDLPRPQILPHPRVHPERG